MADSPKESDPEQVDEKKIDKKHHHSDQGVKPEPTDVQPRAGFKGRLTGYAAGYWAHKRWSLPATLLVVVLVLFGIPLTRYAVLGMFLKETVQISVVDNTTHTPVSGARVHMGSQAAATSAKGKAALKLPVGHGTLVVTKQYYKDATDKFLVSYSKSHNSVTIHLVATGRQVPITVINRITGKPVANAELKVLNTEAKTDKAGKAIIVLPVGAPTQAGTVTAGNYNKTSVKVTVTTDTIPANTYALTPSGSVYFLSNLSGKIDVVKTNLDGTDRKTVLAGTGNEDPRNTVLLASRDWKYLALLTQRKPSGSPELDLIDTSTDTMSNIDEGNATFTLYGWAGDRFIYLVNRTNIQSWQNGQGALKSFNAPDKSITLLAQTTGAGSSVSYVDQQFSNVNLVDNQVVYGLGWQTNQYGGVNGKAATLNVVNPDGSNKKTVYSFPATGSSAYFYSHAITVEPYSNPDTLEIDFYDGNTDHYFFYAHGSVTAAPAVNSQNFYDGNYPTYLLSPSGNQTLWSTPTDGKNTLLVGDSSGDNGKKIAELSDYSPYGWYTDNYLLVSKNDSELYAMPVSGGTPVRISDYFKPSQFFTGYGGGYGGI